MYRHSTLSASSTRLARLGVGALLLLGSAVGRSQLAPPPPPSVSPLPVSPLAGALRAVSSARHGGRGADLLPLVPTTVRLRSADVVLTYVPLQEGWQVSAGYDLMNPSSAPAALTLLFPEELCQTGADCSPLRGMFQDLGTRLGSQLIEPLQAPGPGQGQGPATAPDLRPWTSSPGQAYQYPVKVPPKGPTHLSHEYRFDASTGREWWGVHYVSSAGRWGAPVEKVRFTVELKQPPLWVVYPREYTLRSFSEQAAGAGKSALTRLVFTAEKVAARADFLAAFPVDVVAGQAAAGFCTGFRGDQSDAELAQTVRGFDGARLRGCRDLVYALHGFPIKDPLAHASYYGTGPKLPEWADESTFAIAAMPEGRSLQDGVLSAGERAYIKALTDQLGK